MGDQVGRTVPDWMPPEINTGVAHPARVYDYWLGGKDNFPADQQAAEQASAALPTIAANARANRAFLRRVVRFLTREMGVRQFLDVGTGIPTSPNVHEVAQALAPASRVVYVDNDPIVLVHARALLTSSPQGATAYIDADLRDPEQILETARQTLDFDQPVAVVLLTILQLLRDADDPYGIVARLLAAVPSGSYLAVSHPAKDIQAAATAAAAERLNRLMPGGLTLRTYAEVARFLDGLDLVEPGVVQPHQWRPDPSEKQPGHDVTIWCGVARKP